MGQQVLGFGRGQRDGCRFLLSRSGELALDRDARQESICQQDESDMPIPAQVAAHFILIKSQSFGCFQVLFDTPPCANGLHHGGQRRLWWRKDEEVSHLVWIVKATAK